MKKLLTATFAVLAIATPAQAESLSACIQREHIQQRTAQIQRQNSVRQMRVDALTRQIKADLEVASLPLERWNEMDSMRAMAEVQKKLNQSAIDKHQIEVDAANTRDRLKPSSCYR
jgi:hypothetical protein